MSVGRRVALRLIHFYQQAISPWTGPSCRFSPTCSAYSSEAIRRHGLGPGLWLTARRIMRCHPLCRGGCDPVPETFDWHGQVRRLNP